jgi:hypothetical protein
MPDWDDSNGGDGYGSRPKLGYLLIGLAALVWGISGRITETVTLYGKHSVRHLTGEDAVQASWCIIGFGLAVSMLAFASDSRVGRIFQIILFVAGAASVAGLFFVIVRGML